MSWNVEQITAVALGSARADHAAFEAIGLAEMSDACVLDVGCLDGFNTHLKFAPYQNLARIVGIDPNAAAIEHARSITDDARFQWEASALQDFQAPEGSFDVVYLSHVFQHLPDKPAMLELMARLLKPGGFLVIKTVDDAMKVSSPDPDRLMAGVLSLYDEYVRPNMPHTRNTDRYNGSKCYSLLKHAGFADVRIGVFHTDTAEKTAQEKAALFERMTYFRRHVPESCGAEPQRRMDDLLQRWRELFMRDDYYFDTPTIMALGRKPLSGSANAGEGGDANAGVAAGAGEAGASCATASANASATAERFVYCGPFFGEPCRTFEPAREGRWTFAPMTEDDLGEVMLIELAAFPDPWTPLAYATELRHNPSARYVVARDESGALSGYVGWWYAPDSASIAHIAVAEHARRGGLGRALLERACSEAAREGKTAMLLQVRRKNDGARAFYQALGFQQISVSENYYTNPDDDGIVMARQLRSLL
ncbi:MAG: ribosomal protein S18-alanine N-acetyltransferase [Eggerthellaceae bacterium]|nr:ribosomal protein S18-alanine N-acetyltransferase [Eggerthellaceae bacterium]